VTGVAGRAPALDGLRGIAIAAVLVYHFDLEAAPLACLGWSGVELFFVLSGFLITGIVLDTRGERGWLARFWRRRAARIFPLYFALVALCLLLLPRLDHPKAEAFARIAGDETWYWLFLQNFSIASHGFRHAILDVTWSLAIEVQFYLAWPLVVARLGAHRTVVACAALMAFSIALRLALTHLDAWDRAIYVLTPARLDSLMAGSALAAALRAGHWNVVANAARPVLWGALAATALILAVDPTDLAWTSAWSQSIGYTLWAILFAALLARAWDAPRGSLLAGALCHPALVALGRYSYAMYLFAIPVRGLMRDAVLSPQGGAQQLVFGIACFALTFVAAWASWHLLERRFLENPPARAEPAAMPS
jgi:peptidoglycan/LPS O-acetylase OafA/YrhL